MACRCRAMGHLGDEPSDRSLTRRMAIQAKQLAAWAEMASPVLPSANRPGHTSTAKAATYLQDVLGELHDAGYHRALAGETLPTATPARAATLVATGIAAGQLIAVARERQRVRREAWPAASSLDRPASETGSLLTRSQPCRGPKHGSRARLRSASTSDVGKKREEVFRRTAVRLPGRALEVSRRRRQEHRGEACRAGRRPGRRPSTQLTLGGRPFSWET